jgi:hypothetical protein
MLVSGHAGKQRAARARAAVIPALLHPGTEALWMNRMPKHCGVAAAMCSVPAGNFGLCAVRKNGESMETNHLNSKVKCAVGA